LEQSIDWSAYREHLSKLYTKQNTSQQYSYAVKYHRYLEDPRRINDLPIGIRSSVLKALIALSKYLGCYTEFTASYKNHGVKWTNKNSLSVFLNIINNNHADLINWFRVANTVLRENEKLFMKYCLLSGLRKQEAIDSFNMIIDLSTSGKLDEYYDRNTSCLQHFKYQKFLRGSKNAFITALPIDLLNEVSKSSPVSYSKIRKRLLKQKLPIRIKELRSYYATYLRNHGIISEYVDLFQGRVSKDVFVRNYLKVEDLKALVSHILDVVKDLDISTA
jgi:intergrase/recombinase